MELLSGLHGINAKHLLAVICCLGFATCLPVHEIWVALLVIVPHELARWITFVVEPKSLISSTGTSLTQARRVGGHGAASTGSGNTPGWEGRAQKMEPAGPQAPREEAKARRLSLYS